MVNIPMAAKLQSIRESTKKKRQKSAVKWQNNNKFCCCTSIKQKKAGEGGGCPASPARCEDYESYFIRNTRDWPSAVVCTTMRTP